MWVKSYQSILPLNYMLFASLILGKLGDTGIGRDLFIGLKLSAVNNTERINILSGVV